MKLSAPSLALFLAVTGCYRQDPVVRAAHDLQRMADDLVRYEEDRTRRFQSIQLGMSQGEVVKILGAPAAQRLVEGAGDGQRDEWTYRNSLRPLGTLIFVYRKLVTAGDVGATYQFTLTGAANAAGGIAAYRDVDLFQGVGRSNPAARLSWSFPRFPRPRATRRRQ